MGNNETDFQIGDVRIRPNRLEVHRHGETITVEPKVMALLVALAAHRGDTVSREKLMAEVWPEVHVSEDALHRCIWKARRALGDSGANPRILGTVSRQGYRLLVPVSAGTTGEPTHAPSARGYRFAAAAALAIGLTLALMLAVVWPFGARPVAPPAAVPLTALSGYETRPAFSPDGRRVVFQHYRRTGPLKGQSDLMLAPVEAGGPVTDLTTTAAHEVSPDWARGSDRIAFRRLRDTECRLIVLELATRAESEIGTCDAGARCSRPQLAAPLAPSNARCHTDRAATRPWLGRTSSNGYRECRSPDGQQLACLTDRSHATLSASFFLREPVHTLMRRSSVAR